MDMDEMESVIHETEEEIICSLENFQSHLRKLEELRAEAERMHSLHEAKLKFLSLDPNALSESADVVIEVEDGGQLPAHRLILSSRSPVFKLQFENCEKVVKIADASLAVMGVVVKFCYTAEIKFTDEASVLEVLEVAHNYKIDYLLDLCAEELLKMINKDNVLEISKLSQMYGLETLQKAALRYMNLVLDAALRS